MCSSAQAALRLSNSHNIAATAGTPANFQLSDHDLPLQQQQAAAPAVQEGPESHAWLMRAKPLNPGAVVHCCSGGACARPSPPPPPPLHSSLYTLPPSPLSGSGRFDGSDARPGYASSLAKPFTADACDTDAGLEDEDLIQWAT
jgi:hypothetical protein